MKMLTVRLPEAMVAQIKTEARKSKRSTSDIVRERLGQTKTSRQHRSASYDAIADLVGSVKGLPADLSARKKRYLKTGYGRKRPR